MKKTELNIREEIEQARKDYPRAMKLTLAKILHEKHPSKTVESWRDSIRYLTGSHGNIHRNTNRDPIDDFMQYINPDIEVIPDPLRLKSGKMLIISDTHGYNHTPDLKESFIRGKEAGCDHVLLNGDICDFEAISRWTPTRRATIIQEEIDMIRELLDDINTLFPNARKIYKKGNHEDWFDRCLWSNVNTLMECDDFMNQNKIENYLKPQESGFEFVQSRQVIYAGKLLLIHGHEAKRSGKYIANTMLEYFKCDVAFGHFHRYDYAKFQVFGGDVIQAHSLPCARDFNTVYMGINPQWSKGYAICEFTENEYQMDVKIT